MTESALPEHWCDAPETDVGERWTCSGCGAVWNRDQYIINGAVLDTWYDLADEDPELRANFAERTAQVLERVAYLVRHEAPRNVSYGDTPHEGTTTIKIGWRHGMPDLMNGIKPWDY